jgi:hypothetical protein
MADLGDPGRAIEPLLQAALLDVGWDVCSSVFGMVSVAEES